MTKQTSLQKRLQEYRVYRKFEEETVKPFLEELWYLRVPAFTAVLSLIFFAGIDQTLEVYRVFALNPSFTQGHIWFSFVSIFFLSLVIWHSGEALADRRVAELAQVDLYFHVRNYYYYLKKKHKVSWKEIQSFTKDGICGICTTLNGIRSVLYLIYQDMKSPKHNLINEIKDVDEPKNNFRKPSYSKARALLWLPRIFGFLPLLALSFGLFRTLWAVGFGLFLSDNIMTGFLGTIVALSIITIFIVLLILPDYPVAGLLILIIFLIPIFLKTETTNGQECIKTIFNIEIGCQLSPVLYLVFGILITVFLSVWYFKVYISRKKARQNEESKQPTIKRRQGQILSPFELNDSSDLLFSNPVLVSLSCLSIVSLYIFTIPLVTNALVRLIIGLVFIVFVVFQFLKIRSVKKTDAHIYQVLFGYIILFLTIFSFILLLVPLVAPLVAPYIGSIIIIVLFLIMFLTLSSTIFYVEYKTRIPFITILLICVLVFGSFGWNDNHRLRELPEKPKSQLLPLEAQFNIWIKSRQDDIVAFKAKNKEYPIYVVSAQGGGIFAAYHAASTLSRLQDLCPAFAHHVFAISGVSGGSLGATAFSSLINSEKPPDTQNSVQPKYTKDCPGKVENADLNPNNRGILENYAHQLLNQDFLSPLLAAGLFPDFFQRFLFFPIEDVDRARGLEYAFEQGWNSIKWRDKNDQKKHPNLLNKSYYDHWNPKSVAPALVLNTTVVETGERLLLSPFTFKTADSSTVKFPDLVDINTVASSKFKECKDKNNSHINFRLSTAAFLSARFPFITPVGWFNRCYDKKGDILADQELNSKSRLADGGYFENSGFTTAFEIGQGLQEILDHGLESQIDQDIVKSTTGDLHKIPKIRIVYLALTDNSPLNQQSGGNDLFSPMNALYNSREARGRSIIEQAEYKIDSNLNDDENKIVSKHDFRQFYLTHFAPSKDNGAVNVCRLGNAECKSIGGKSNFNLPLGWYLSKFSQDYIRDRIGNPNPIACPPASDYPNANNNHCIMKSVIDELELTH
ncbi:patatin-like phospholipase family protein [Nostoc sp. 'Peltigera membranacea cyanobiont' N6]|uniref:patatin-like phospholipase family protein n=1 Tax=Nostoc sp. 'Peltigera membranacea cyanobiont' N6 TaxID=1261031 RepID=UPI000CF3286A|nr:patatin-like phospholipase family protein [Nostoc sp. 'Peltigera membranacea cyanobiont' N6]AVH68316.1 patatin-like phospholipase [Nostoc sp. 'Peltigera membranacea cyanobiont' N6]